MNFQFICVYIYCFIKTYDNYPCIHSVLVKGTLRRKSESLMTPTCICKSCNRDKWNRKKSKRLPVPPVKLSTFGVIHKTTIVKRS